MLDDIKRLKQQAEKKEEPAKVLVPRAPEDPTRALDELIGAAHNAVSAAVDS